MATIQVTFTHPQASYTRTVTLTDANMTRMVNAAKEVFYHPKGPIGGDPSPLTGTQALERVVDTFVGELKRMTRDYEAAQAAKTATDAIVLIDTTG